MRSSRLDFCDVCGEEVPQNKLVRTQIRWLRGAGANHFPAHLYNSTDWVCDATDKSTISAGPWISRCSVADDNTVTEVGGWQTWEGDGVFRLVSPIDISGWTTLCMSADVGAYHANTTPSLTVKMGCCNSDGSVKYVQRTWTYSGNKRAWFTATIADLVTDGVTSSAAYFYVEVENDGYWHVANLQLEDDATKPGDFVPNATGAAVDYTSESIQTSVVKVCEKHREVLRRDSEELGVPRREVEDPIRVMVQEN